MALTEDTTKRLWFNGGYQVSRRILEETPAGERVAIMGVTDELALGALRSIRDIGGLAVPYDVAVIGLDGTHGDSGADWVVSLSSITLPGYRMGEEAVRLVHKEAETGQRHERVVMPISIRHRGSTLEVAG